MNHEHFLPEFFSSTEFVTEHVQFIKRYAKLRVKGYPPVVCLRQTFGPEMAANLAIERIAHLESTFLYQQEYEKALKNTPQDELWSARLAIAELLSVARNPNEKGSTRVAAARELNTLCAITITDANGNTVKAGASLADFYAMSAEQQESIDAERARRKTFAEQAGKTPTTH